MPTPARPTPIEAAVPPALPQSTTREAGRGGIAIAGAKLYFILAGFVQQIVLKKLLGLAGYGALGLVQSWASILYNPVVQTGIQGVSRAMASAPEAEREVAGRRSLTLQILAMVPLVLLFFASAPLAAARFWHLPELALPLRIVVGVLFCYGIYAPLVGMLNGRREYLAQAGLDALFTTLRTALLLGGAWLLGSQGRGVEGALGGFVIAALLICIIAFFVARFGGRGDGGPTTRDPLRFVLPRLKLSPPRVWWRQSRDHLRFVLPLFGGQFALNLLFQSDTQVLAHFAGKAAARADLGREAATSLVGAYRAAQLFCFLPYQLLLSVTFVLFPLLASAWRDGDRDTVVRLVQQGVRLGLVVAGLLASVNAALSYRLISLVFDRDAAELGARAMCVLALGLGAFAIFGLFTTVLTSLRQERTSALLTVAALVLVLGLCSALLHAESLGEPMLLRTAVATSAGLFAATLTAARSVHRRVGAVVSIVTVIRVATCAAIAIAAGRTLATLVSPSRVWTVGLAAVVAVIYLAALVVARELGRADLQLVLATARRRSS